MVNSLSSVQYIFDIVLSTGTGPKSCWSHGSSFKCFSIVFPAP